MKHVFALLFLSCCLSANAQLQTCGEAWQNLQVYANQVNLMYVQYYNAAPMNCGYMVNQCIYNLNNWYYNQCVMVNQWYATVVNQCNLQSQSGSRVPRHVSPRSRGGSSRMPDISTDDMEDLEVDEETSDKQVRIRIPNNPTGWRGN